MKKNSTNCSVIWLGLSLAALAILFGGAASGFGRTAAAIDCPNVPIKTLTGSNGTNGQSVPDGKSSSNGVPGGTAIISGKSVTTGDLDKSGGCGGGNDGRSVNIGAGTRDDNSIVTGDNIAGENGSINIGNGDEDSSGNTVVTGDNSIS